MLYTDFLGETVSRLGFGMMRLPLLPGGSGGDVDEELVAKMVDHAIEHGVNYFDTAAPYHGNKGEWFTGNALARYPRDSFYLATKYPGHQITSVYTPEKTFEGQLKKCGTDYFDFYLFHNVFENSFLTYDDPKWGIIDYFIEQKKLGRVRHLGFSSHGDLPIIQRFMEKYGEHIEFVQLQINYLDWMLQKAKEKYEYFDGLGIPIIVMEPVRGGKLAKLPDEAEQKMRAYRPDESTAAWCFRWLQALPNVKVVLSGMSNMEQVADNVKSFEEEKPLTEEENRLLSDIARDMFSLVPCTGCRYCTGECPMELNIPLFLNALNDMTFSMTVNSAMKIETLPEDRQPQACLACGACVHMCPQKIDIPAELARLVEKMKTAPSWKEICRQREEEAARIANMDLAEK